MNNNAVLIVDDDVDARYFLRTSLESSGYTVIEAPEGNTAIRLYHEFKPAVVVLDLGIGHPDGLEVCRTMRRTSNVPIIMLTSHTSEIDEAMCLAAGADDFVTKPVTSRIIALHVAAQIRRATLTPNISVANNLPVTEYYLDSPEFLQEDESTGSRFSWPILVSGLLVFGSIVAFIVVQFSNSFTP